MSGIGRAGFGSDYALASRYVTFSSLLWVANVFYLYLFASGRAISDWDGKKRSLNVRYCPLFVLAFILMMFIVNSVYGAMCFNVRYQYLAAARDELLSKDNDSFLTLLYPKAATVKERLPVLKKYHLSLFRNVAKEGYDSLAKVKKRTKKDMAINPLLDSVYCNLGVLYYKEKKYVEAEYLWKKTLEINPNYINAYLSLAVYYYGEKDYALARHYALAARKRGAPIDPEFLKALNLRL
jgi:tetratricopeptide (TPR) repeat protein